MNVDAAMLEDSDSNINGPISSGNSEIERQSELDVVANDASDLEEDIVHDYDEFLVHEPVENVDFVPLEDDDQVHFNRFE